MIQREGIGSNVVIVPGDGKLYEALLSSPICQNEDGSGGRDFDFNMDADDDPELALVSNFNTFFKILATYEPIYFYKLKD